MNSFILALNQPITASKPFLMFVLGFNAGVFFTVGVFVGSYLLFR